MPTVGQEGRPAVRVLSLRGVDSGDRFGGAASCGHAHQARVDEAGREQDRPGGAPTAAQAVWRGTHFHRCTPGDGHPHEFAAREVTERRAVGRPEWLLCPLRPRNGLRIGLVQPPHVELRRGAVLPRRESQASAIGGDRRRRPEHEPGGQRPGEPHQRGRRRAGRGDTARPPAQSESCGQQQERGCASDHGTPRSRAYSRFWRRGLHDVRRGIERAGWQLHSHGLLQGLVDFEPRVGDVVQALVWVLLEAAPEQAMDRRGHSVR